MGCRYRGGVRAAGALAVRGNHDNADLATASDTMNAEAQAAIEWTRGRLNAPSSGAFLAGLPILREEDEDRLFVHARRRSR
jgi:hypothetical protein